MLNEKIKDLDGWKLSTDQKAIEKEFHFKSYLKNIAFVNAVAWIAHKENHHPDLIIKYHLCKVILTTHDSGELSEKDFELAKKIDLL